MTAMPLFIGYDEREREAYHVCRLSAERRSSIPLHIMKLDQASLHRNGWYSRESRSNHKGQRIDVIDRQPFSTDFSFTRFLVPALALHQGWALYCDCDFLFTADLAGLFALADPQFAVMCVKHHHFPRETSKMNGLQQAAYYRKNWSSLVLWNCEHPANRVLNSYVVNNTTGQWLHAFQWLTDEEVGELPLTWNWLSGVSDPIDGHLPCGIHFTLGTPDTPGCGDAPYAELWHAEKTSRRVPGRPTPSESLRAIA